MKIINLIKDWADKFCLPTRNECTFDNTSALLIQEELNELIKALYDKDKKEVADAYGDIIWLTIRSMMENGMHDKLEQIIEAVYNSNMTKSVTTIDDINASVEAYNNKGVNVFVEYQTNSDCVIIRRAIDNKVLKGCNFKEPDLSFI